MPLPAGDYTLRGMRAVPIRRLEAEEGEVWHWAHGEIVRHKDDPSPMGYQSWCGEVHAADEVVVQPDRHVGFCGACAEAMFHKRRPTTKVNR